MTPTETIRSVFASSLLEPVRAMRARYVPLLMIYFAQGAQQIVVVEQQFLERERLTIPAAALAELGVWLTVPWTIKMVFGQLVDGVTLFGSRRRVYVFVGAGLMTIGFALLSSAAQVAVPPQSLYIAGRLLVVVGVVLQDVVADTMSTEVVDRTLADGSPRDETEVDADLGMVQVLGRLAMMLGVLLGAFVGGLLATAFDADAVYAMAIGVPLISVLGAIFVRVDATEPGDFDPRILGGGLAFGMFSIGMRYLEVPNASEIVVAVSFATVLGLLWLNVRDLPRDRLVAIAAAAFVIFVFRATPTGEPGVTWWSIDVLGFDEVFMGSLASAGSLFAIFGMWFGSRAVTHRPIGQVLIALTIASFVLSLPYVAMLFGLHEWTHAHLGFGARSIAIIDSSLALGFGQVAMIPMLTLIAVNAPPHRRATWFALMASFMNLAHSAAELITKGLNEVFVIERGNYAQLPTLMIVVSLIGLVLPIASVLAVRSRLAEAG